MALKVTCGVSGRARIITTSQSDGEIVQDTGEFQNIWTDVGLDHLSGYSVKSVQWPNLINYGEGARSEPHNTVTSLANPVGYGFSSYEGLPLPDELEVTPETCTVTRTRSITIAARGEPWTLRELGLSIRGIDDLLTYTLVKNTEGVPTQLEISETEVATIYYTLQITYPMILPPQQIEVEGLPPTTAIFKLKPLGVPGSDEFIRKSPTSSAVGSQLFILDGFTSEDLAGRVRSDSTEGNARRFSTDTLNRSTEFFGSMADGANHIWQLDPPIVKNNKQILDIEEYWQFSNVPVVEG